MPKAAFGEFDLYYESHGAGEPVLLVPGLGGLGGCSSCPHCYRGCSMARA